MPLGSSLIVEGSGSLFASSRRRKMTIDPIMAAGSLSLIEPGNPVMGWAPGVPVSGASVFNIARINAASVMGVTVSATDGTVYNAGLSGAKGLVERTSKGAIHAVLATTGVGSGDAFVVDHSPAVIDWMKANPTHGYYVSLWERTTRAASGSGNQIIHSIQSGSTFAFGATAIGLVGLVNLGYNNLGSNPGWNGMGPKLFAQAGSGLASGFTTAATSGIDRMAFVVGARGYANGGNTANYGKTGSRVFMRGYVEDLTVSGRTYAQAFGLDQTEFTKQVMTVGGRYYGDTYTNPA